MWQTGWRDQIWSELSSPWDLIIIGGGITGAGILREAARAGLRPLLLEKNDFASGTSSRSSKLVHGGLRYLKNMQFKLTYESVRERERLLREARGLVNPLGFLVTSYAGDALPGWMFGIALTLYDTLAWKWGHRYYDADDLHELCPVLGEDGLQGGYRYFDAQTDDARLVLRVLEAGLRQGGAALNYVRATALLRDASGRVCGVRATDTAPGSSGRQQEVLAPVVINAAGAWADELRQDVGGAARLRKLRGSHLVLSASRLPLTRAVSLLHPKDGRPVFAFPWEGVTLLGTTDMDHKDSLDSEPAISPQEAEYLMQFATWAFPQQELSLADVQSSFAGVRPVIGTGKADPSKESREHVLWWEDGLLTVAGGKLTTFRRMALDTLRLVARRVPALRGRLETLEHTGQVLDTPTETALPAALPAQLPQRQRLRLLGRYGSRAATMVSAVPAAELEPIPGAPALWGELRWAAGNEAVVHLDDLLLRRVRLGLVLPQGGLPLMDRIRHIVQPELGWSDERWEQECNAYAQQWKQCYHLA